MLAAGAYIVTNIFYVVFASGDLQPWGSLGIKSEGVIMLTGNCNSCLEINKSSISFQALPLNQKKSYRRAIVHNLHYVMFSGDIIIIIL